MAGLLGALAGLLGQGQAQPSTVPQQTVNNAHMAMLSGGQVPTAASGVPQVPQVSTASQPTVDASGQPVDPNAATQVAPVTITASRPPPAPYHSPGAAPSATQLGNTSELANATQADQGTPASPQPGNLNYGGIPGALGAHGTLGSLLGHLGDAFLIGSGRTPFHVAQAQQQQLAQASVGSETDPRAAAARVAATGVPGAEEASQKLIDEANQQDLRKQVQQQNFQYQQSRIAEQTDNTIARRAPAAQGFVQGASDAATYAKKYALLDAQVKGIDPQRSAADAYGIPTPDQWQPGMMNGVGMTSNQQQVSSDKGASRQVSMRDTDVNAGSRIGAANINAGAHVQGAQISAGAHPTATGLVEQIMSIPAAQRSPEQSAYLAKALTPARSGGIHLGVQPGTAGSVPVSNAGAGNPVANGGRPITPQQAATLPKGTHFLTSDGRWLVR